MAIAIKPAMTGKKQLGPLGLLPDFVSASALAQDIVDKIRFLEDFDMERERKILTAEINDEFLSHVMVREFKRFFSLELLFPDADYPFVPSEEIDPIWHDIVLDSRRYVGICEKLYGGYVHHTPVDTCPGEMAQNAGERFGHTKRLLERAFGGITPSAWGVAAYCNRAACTWP
ncbi:hypothetical protein [Methylobacterium bullatum]|uniref:hypothetical protein n=1 Tax=Methylobacterium bullatum TaxID=570505 RepID=UPI00178218EB|nr:hypothetical protein [Methylobacterium bullatum]